MDLEARPLTRHRLAMSRDPELVRAAVSNALGDHRLSLIGRDVALDAHFHGLQLNGCSVYYLEYGTDVRIDVTESDAFHVVHVPLAGRASICVGSTAFVSTPERAAIIAPGRGLSVELGNTCRYLLMRVEHASIQRLLRKKLGREPAAPLVFEPAMDLTTPGSRTFRGLLDLFVRSVDAAAAPSSLIALREFERLLISQLILGQPNNYLDELGSKPRPAVARPIVRAAELIEAHAHEPLTVDDIADAVGLGTRALQDGFRRYYDTTPTAFLRDIRLRRVRTELMQAEPTGTTVTAVAGRWGFTHPGRFSVMYHRRFGEPPSQTLRFSTDGSLARRPLRDMTVPAFP